MTPRSWFALALRLLGVWAAIEGIDQIVVVLNIKAGVFQPGYTQASAYALHAAAKILVAFVLLVGAPMVAAYFYGSGAEKSGTSDPPPTVRL
jgi:hypothetical protein